MVRTQLSEAAKRRVRAGRMLLAGKRCADIAEAVGVARQTVYTWKALLDEGGIEALRAVPDPGRPARLSDTQLAQVRAALLQSPTEHGFGTELWTLKRVGILIHRLTGVRFGQTQVWAFSARWASARKSPRSARSSGMRMRCAPGSDAPGLCLKKAQREGRLIVFVDESGISERPTRVRTWAPKGETPIIQFHFNWDHVSVIAGLTRSNCLFRLHEGSIRREEIVAFLKALQAHLRQPLLVIWDGLRANRSHLVRERWRTTPPTLLPNCTRLPATN